MTHEKSHKHLIYIFPIICKQQIHRCTETGKYTQRTYGKELQKNTDYFTNLTSKNLKKYEELFRSISHHLNIACKINMYKTDALFCMVAEVVKKTPEELFIILQDKEIKNN